jgi:ubiquinone/menaquinone biosynthesis C-methylase UbiE
MADYFTHPSLAQRAGESLEYVIKGPLYRRYVNSLEIRGDERALEFGCLGGGLSRYLADRLSGGGALTCVDIGRFWIERARKRLKKRFDNVVFKLGDVRTLELVPDSHDAVFVHFALHDVPPPDRQDIVNVLARILAKGGKLYLREPTRPSHGMAAEEIRKLMAKAKLQEVSAQETRSFIRGPMFEAVYQNA